MLKARFLAALLAGRMSCDELGGWIQEHDGRDAVAELVESGAVRRTRDGGADLIGRRRDSALQALARDLRLDRPGNP
jgi:hypothetical protein